MAVCASGSYHCLFLDSLASVWSCGFNQHGGLGLGHSTTKLTPEKINNLPPIISISAGYEFSLFVDANGSVWSCGYNGYGQLGLGDVKNRNIPEQIKNLPAIKSALAFGNSSLFLDCEGSVWSCWYNHYGELGLGDTTQRNKAEKIQGLPAIKSMAGGYYHALFLDCEGSVWSCGYNGNGELGLGDTTQRNKAEKIQGLPAIKLMAGGYNHALFLDCEGSVWSCGYNANGALGLGDTRDRNKAEKIQGLPAIKSTAGGWHFSMFVDEQGNVWICGGNQKGELGLGHTTQINSPQKNNNLSGIVAVAGGNPCFSMFLDKQGNVFTCGNNQYGQLGLGDKNDRHTPQKVNNIPPMSSLSSCNTAHYYLQIVDCEGGVWSCGRNDYGQLGVGHTNDTLTFQQIASIPKLKGKEEAMQEGSVEGKKQEEAEEGSVEEKEMFKSIEKQQSKELMLKMQSAKGIKQLDKHQAKQKIIEGVIGVAEWTTKWQEIHKKKQQLHQSIQQQKLTLLDKQQQLDKLTQEIKEIQQALSNMEQNTKTFEFYDEFLQPIAEAEKELKSGFQEKLNARKHADFTVDEVSLFLNVCGMQDLVIHQRTNKWDGATLEDAIEEVSAMKISDTLQKCKMEFYLKVLESGKLMKEEELSQCTVWRHKEVEKTLLLLKEWDIALDEQLVKKKGICVVHLLYFHAKDFKMELGVEGKEAIAMVRKLKSWRKSFEDSLFNTEGSG